MSELANSSTFVGSFWCVKASEKDYMNYGTLFLQLGSISNVNSTNFHCSPRPGPQHSYKRYPNSSLLSIFVEFLSNVGKRIFAVPALVWLRIPVFDGKYMMKSDSEIGQLETYSYWEQVLILDKPGSSGKQSKDVEAVLIWNKHIFRYILK